MARPRNTSPLFFLVAIIAVLAALFFAKQILLPISLAVLLTFLLTPLANRIESWGVPRVPAVILVVFVAFAVLGVLGYIVAGQVAELRNELPTHSQQIYAKVRALRHLTSRVQKVGEDLAKGKEIDIDPERKAEAETYDGGRTNPSRAAEELAGKSQPAPGGPDEVAEEVTTAEDEQAVAVKVVEMPPSPLTQVQTWLGPLVAPLTSAGMVVVLVFFLLLDRENQRNRLIHLFGTSNLHTTTEALHDATYRVGRYLRMLFLVNASYGLAVAVGLYFIAVPGWVMWGVLGFVLRFLPYLGPWISAVLPIMVSLAVSPGWTQPMLVVGMYLAYELVLNNVAEPLLYGSSIGVTTVGVIISAIFWTWLWGPVGLVLAMPMTVCLVVLAQYVPQLRFISVLLADRPAMTPAEQIYQRLLAFDYQEPLKLARTHVKTASLLEFYDTVLIPALNLAERDRYADLLDMRQEEFIAEAAEDLVEELGESAVKVMPEEPEGNGRAGDSAAAETRATARILCVPLRDEADEIAARMLAQLLQAEGLEVETGTSELLTSEIVDRVAESQCDVVVISVLPPIRPRDSRLLRKRLRQRYPDLPVIVGYWIGGDDKSSLPQGEGDQASRTVATLAEAVKQVRGTAAQLQLSKAV